MPTTITSAGITFNDATSLTSANIGTAQIANGSVTAAKLGTTEQKQIAKAWVNFNGTTSPGTIRSSYNVSSITKNGTGDYTVNFATAMADANYSASGGISQNVSSGGYRWIAFGSNAAGNVSQTINSIRCQCTYGTAVIDDATSIFVQIFGN